MQDLKTVLLADDSEDDVFLLRRGFVKAGISIPLARVSDGEEAVSYLTTAGQDSSPLPSLFLLDLEMPRMDGYSVLQWLQSQPRLNQIPVVVISSVIDDTEGQRVRGLGARDYFAKPNDPHEYTLLAKHLSERWLNGNEQHSIVTLSRS